MAALKNIRHEAFCQHLITGKKYGLTQGEAYIKAGYRARGHSAEQLASLLLKNVEIHTRIAELSAPKDVVNRVNVSAQALIAKAETLYERGVAKDQLNAVGKAIELQGKLGGALIERVEVAGAGEFARCRTPDEVIEKLLDDHGSAAAAIEGLRYMLDLLEERAALTARPVMGFEESREESRKNLNDIKATS